jgi:hypothetical protein
LVIVILSIVGLFFGNDSKSAFGSQTTIIRSFRIIKIFYLFKRNKALKSTLMTFVISFPAMANIGSLLLLLNLIYSVLGVYLFAEVKFNGDVFNENYNF